MTARRFLARLDGLAARMNVRSRGRCRCPLCSRGEQIARAGIGMAPRHPERITRELPDAQEEQLAELAAELWPDDEWTEITAETRKEDG